MITSTGILYYCNKNNLGNYGNYKRACLSFCTNILRKMNYWIEARSCYYGWKPSMGEGKTAWNSWRTSKRIRSLPGIHQVVHWAWNSRIYCIRLFLRKLESNWKGSMRCSLCIIARWLILCLFSLFIRMRWLEWCRQIKRVYIMRFAFDLLEDISFSCLAFRMTLFCWVILHCTWSSF